MPNYICMILLIVFFLANRIGTENSESVDNVYIVKGSVSSYRKEKWN